MNYVFCSKYWFSVTCDKKFVILSQIDRYFLFMNITEYFNKTVVLLFSKI